jgi:hypothetical protein
VPCSAIVSNVQDLGGPLLVSSGQALTFAEYDAQREVVARFGYALEGPTEDDFAHRVLKYGFGGLWFVEDRAVTPATAGTGGTTEASAKGSCFSSCSAGGGWLKRVGDPRDTGRS